MEGKTENYDHTFIMGKYNRLYKCVRLIDTQDYIYAGEYLKKKNSEFNYNNLKSESMNSVTLFGNVGGDPIINTTESGKKVAKFSLATKKNKEITDWHNIILWEKLADLAELYVRKGSGLIVVGEIKYRKYENNDGMMINVTEIVANQIYFTEKKQSIDTEKYEGKWQGGTKK